MMSLTGNKKNGFTLVEAMFATMVLSLGAVLLYEAFFISIDAFNYCADYLSIASLADEKMWEAQDSLSRTGGSDLTETGGILEALGKTFRWGLSYGLVDEAQSLYRVDLEVAWKEGKRDERISRAGYAIYREKK